MSNRHYTATHCSACARRWKLIAESKVQKLNKLVSGTDRGKMTLNGLGLKTEYRDRKIE